MPYRPLPVVCTGVEWTYSSRLAEEVRSHLHDGSRVYDLLWLQLAVEVVPKPACLPACLPVDSCSVQQLLLELDGVRGWGSRRWMKSTPEEGLLLLLLLGWCSVRLWVVKMWGENFKPRLLEEEKRLYRQWLLDIFLEVAGDLWAKMTLVLQKCQVISSGARVIWSGGMLPVCFRAFSKTCVSVVFLIILLVCTDYCY